MHEQGKVKTILGERMIIEIPKHSCCSGCGACTFNEQGVTELTVPYVDGAEPGTEVELDFDGTASKNLLKITAAVYLTPLVGLILGAVIGTVFWNDIVGAILSLVLGAVFFCGVKLWDRHFSADRDVFAHMTVRVKR